MVGAAHANGRAKVGCMRQPMRTNSGKPCAPGPYPEPVIARLHKPLKQQLRRAEQSKRRKIGRRIGKPIGIMRAIDAKAYAYSKFGVRKRRTLNKHPRQLRAVAERVIGPFQLKRNLRREGAQRIDKRHAGHKTKLWRKARRRRINQQQRGVKIARRRDPGPAKPPAPRRLLPRHDPQAPNIARAGASKSLVARRAESLKGLDPVWREPGQNSDFAAACAEAATKGPGKIANSTTISPITAMTAVTSQFTRSNGRAGSSKYMILTTRR